MSDWSSTDVYLRWVRNLVRENHTRDDVLCFHTGSGRYSLSPQVIESYREPQGPVRKRLVWTPGRSIRSCCAGDVTDPVPRVLWWLEVNERINELRKDHSIAPNPYSKRLVADLPEWMNALALTVPLPSSTASEFVELWATRGRRARGEALRTWYTRCWHEAEAQLKTRTPAAYTLTTAEARALFGLPSKFTPEELKKAYRKAAFAAHPDAGGTHEGFLRVGAAYTLLKPADSLPRP